MKKLAKYVLLSLLTATFVIPSDVLAASSPTTTNAVSPASTTTEVLRVTQLGNGEYADSAFIYMNTSGTMSFVVTQSSNINPAYVNYKLIKPEPDGTATIWGSAVFEGDGTFSFTSKPNLPVGTYYLRAKSLVRGRTAVTATVTTP
ncbi:hypothetical protein [Brevibacillus brevis]|uniref:Uncharacterized protein n=1 Tax=Brevibacillus brevis TaxID=1393 RepID=A0ABY9T328_BREBE|nr:hypothetical protein [Brevibacillus brevis]WNC14485.1 hypothetical protein RGB73_28120 [Brevibacillus brevis]